jgi:hypothetical protein
LTATYVGVGSAGNLLSGSAELTYNTATATAMLDKTVDTSLGFRSRNASAGVSAQANFIVDNGAVNGAMSVYKMGTGAAYGGLFTANMGGMHNANGSMLFTNAAIADMIWATGGTLATNERMRLNADSLVVIGQQVGAATIAAINNNAGASYARVYTSNGTSANYMYKLGTGWATNGLQVANQAYLVNTAGSTLTTNVEQADFIWSIGGNQVTDERMRLNAANGLHVSKDQDAGTYIHAKNLSAGAAAQSLIYAESNSGWVGLMKNGPGFTPSGLLGAGGSALYNTSGSLLYHNNAAADHIWTIGGLGNEAMRLTANTLTVATKPVMCYRGQWSSIVVYAPGDVVFYGGNNFVCLLGVSGALPSNTTYWSMSTGNIGRPVLTDAVTIIWDVTAAPVAVVTLVASRSLAILNPVVGQTYRLQVSYTGAFTITFPSICHWPNNNTPPVLTSTAGKLDLLTFVCLDPSFLAGSWQLAYT